MKREQNRLEMEVVKSTFDKTPPDEQESLRSAYERFKDNLSPDSELTDYFGFWSFLRLVMKLTKAGAFAVD